MDAIRQLIKRVKATGDRRADCVRTLAMGGKRVFEAFDVGEDTFIFERGVSAHLQDRPSALIVEKRSLRSRTGGRVMTLSTGNHSVAAFPLMDGRFWGLSHLHPEERSRTLSAAIICANAADGRLEISQREVSTETLVRSDAWLQLKAGLPMDAVVMCDRNETTLDYYRRRGQEWRVKPIAWSEAEMRCALSASRKRIASHLEYFHSARGVHFLTLPEFRRLAALARTDAAAFLKGLKELTAVFEGNRVSFTRMPKYHGHHEIELFGMRRGEAIVRLVPELEKLMEAAVLGRLGRLGLIQRADEIAALWETLLVREELADESSKVFTETLYMNITGEVYQIVGEGMTPAFDDRRTALPGATFFEGRLQLHPGADSRSEVLFANLRRMLSEGEYVEYANVYELREEGDAPLGRGATRELVYKTNLRPVEASFIEKGLSSRSKGYSDYMLARVGAMRAMDIGMSSYYRLLRRRAASGGRKREFYIRLRCEGEPLESIPASYFRTKDSAGEENRDNVLALAALMGDAAAQNLAVKKYDQKTESPLFGVGKEIYEFDYDIDRECQVPKKVRMCSIRGSFGWPDLEESERNFDAIVRFYFTRYAEALKDFQRQHSVPITELAEKFMSGFEFRTHALVWRLSVLHDKFDEFSPQIPKRYAFPKKWHFIRWALDEQHRKLESLRKFFFAALG